MKPAALFLALAGVACAQSLSGEQIRKILADRIEIARQSEGIAVGIIEPTGRRVIAAGHAIDGDTLFEIASVTKTFTSLLLSDMNLRGEVNLADPVAKYLPAGVQVPRRAGRAITLEDLSRHVSGLPKLPSNLQPKELNNPYADYSVADLYSFLSTYELPREPGRQFEYSNLGAGLLGHALALRYGADYESLLRARVLGPLGMNSTAAALTPELAARKTQGHDSTLAASGDWELGALAGAGGLWSSANDMLRYLEAFLGYSESPLSPAMAAMLQNRKAINSGTEIGLGWLVRKSGNGEIVWHDGGSGGFASFVGFHPASRTGVVVLSNASNSVDDIGLHILDPRNPLVEARKQITLAPEVLGRYAGRYQVAPGVVLTISREGSRLFGQLAGQAMLEMFAESEREFFLRATPLRVTFEAGEGGTASAAVLHQADGRDVRAERLPGEAAARTEIQLAAEVLDRYVGRYQLANLVIEVTRDGARLFAQASGQETYEIFAESERAFFYKVVDAQITFGDDEMVVRRGGQELRLKRTPNAAPAR